VLYNVSTTPRQGVGILPWLHEGTPSGGAESAGLLGRDFRWSCPDAGSGGGCDASRKGDACNKPILEPQPRWAGPAL